MALSLRQYAHALVWAKRHLANQFPIPEWAVISEYIKPGDTVFDLGAHGGRWTYPLSKAVGSAGLVYAFEALPYYAQTLSLTLKLLLVRNVRVRNNAVANHNDIVHIAWQDKQGRRLTGRTHIAGANDDAATVSVQAATLDQLVAAEHLQKRVSFIKADIEGAELMALKGGEKLLAQSRPVMFVELVPKHLQRYGFGLNDMFTFLKGQNYKTFTIDKGVLNPTDSSTYAKNDIFCLPAEL